MRHVKRNAKIHLHSTSVFSFLVVSPYHKHDMGDSSSQFTQAGQGMASVVWRTGSQDITYTLVRIQVKSCWVCTKFCDCPALTLTGSWWNVTTDPVPLWGRGETTQPKVRSEGHQADAAPAHGPTECHHQQNHGEYWHHLPHPLPLPHLHTPTYMHCVRDSTLKDDGPLPDYIRNYIIILCCIRWRLECSMVILVGLSLVNVWSVLCCSCHANIHMVLALWSVYIVHTCRFVLVYECWHCYCDMRQSVC